MTNEEMQNTIQFILEQQALFAANQQMLQEAQLRTEKQLRETSAAQKEAHEQVARVQAHLIKVMSELVDAQARTDSQMAETDERLNALINTVERYIGERRNGKKSDENTDS